MPVWIHLSSKSLYIYLLYLVGQHLKCLFKLIATVHIFSHESIIKINFRNYLYLPYILFKIFNPTQTHGNPKINVINSNFIVSKLSIQPAPKHNLPISDYNHILVQTDRSDGGLINIVVT